MIYVKLIGIVLASLILGAIVMVVYIKVLSVLSIYIWRSRLLKRYAVRKSYQFLYTHIFIRVGRVIKNIIRNKPISKKDNNEYNKGNAEYNSTYLESSVPENHTGIIKRQSTKCK